MVLPPTHALVSNLDSDMRSLLDDIQVNKTSNDGSTLM